MTLFDAFEVLFYTCMVLGGVVFIAGGLAAVHDFIADTRVEFNAELLVRETEEYLASLNHPSRRSERQPEPPITE